MAFPLPHSLAHRTADAAAPQERVIIVQAGYHPERVAVDVGAPVRLTFRREGSDPCSDAVLLPELGRFAELPEGRSVSIDCGILEPGEYEFSCERGHLRGRIVVQ
jgi:plastocyanin domain-containing protein